jgi:hypothetical protein
MVKPIQHQRRKLIRGLLITACAGGLPYSALRSAESTAQKKVIEIWKSPTCGCCNDWIKHLEANGFKTRAYDQGNTAKRRDVGMPVQYGSCHTALIEGYVIEGHVPAREIKRLLKERPKALGLAVPEMPIGTPGMDGPEYGGQLDPYNVLLVRQDGTARIYQAYTNKRAPK